jgi:MFS family permease
MAGPLVADETTSEVSEAELPSFAYRSYVLFLTVLVGGISLMDRQILSILVEPIRKEFGLDDKHIGLLTGFAFAVVYVVASIPAARLADRWSRRNVVAIAIGSWSVMTALCGFAQNFWQLFLARIGVGLGEAGGSAPVQALISDLFPRRQRGTAFSIYLLGPPLGMGVGLAAGGWVLAEYGWRTTLIVAGIPGLILVPLLLFTTRDVRAGVADGVTVKQDVRPLGETMLTLWRIRTLPLLMCASTIQALIGMGMINWIPSFFSRSHGLDPIEVGTRLGGALALGSVLGHILGGPLADLLGRRDVRWHLWVPVLGSVGSASVAAFALTGSPELAFPLLGLQVMLTGLSASPMITICTTIAPIWARATSAACLMFIINLVGLGLGPVAIGWLSDVLRPVYGEESLRFALLGALVCAVPAATLFFLASRRYRHDLADAEARLRASGGN